MRKFWKDSPPLRVIATLRVQKTLDAIEIGRGQRISLGCPPPGKHRRRLRLARRGTLKTGARSLQPAPMNLLTRHRHGKLPIQLEEPGGFSRVPLPGNDPRSNHQGASPPAFAALTSWTSSVRGDVQLNPLCPPGEEG